MHRHAASKHVSHIARSHSALLRQSSTQYTSRRHSSHTANNKFTYLGKKPTGMLSTTQLTDMIQSGDIKNVTVGFSNIYGQLLGKRFDSQFFLDSCLHDGTHVCDYLLANDIEQNAVPGYKAINYENGYGDLHIVVDHNTARLTTWQPNTALVICDVYDNKTHELFKLAPRSILRRQIDACGELGYSCMAATELEYYTYHTPYKQAAQYEYRQHKVQPVSTYLEDYHLLQTYKEEPYTSTFRQHLQMSGIPVENSKGEAGIGQHELNISYSDILQMSDRHTVYKQCLKELAVDMGISVTFMAKPFTDATGSGCHIHLSLHDINNNNKNLFAGDKKLGSVNGTSDLFEHFLAGWLTHTADCMVFYAPTINSYKRYQSASWAPTRVAWSSDNRTAGYRIVGSGKSLRIENRIAGADCNPYLVFAASLAAGLHGIKHKLRAPEEFRGNIYDAASLPLVPKTLQHAVDLFKNSEFAKQAFGQDVVDHYAHFYQTEVQAYNASVTDWERKRYFERI